MAHAAAELRRAVSATAAEVDATVLAFAKTRGGHQKARIRTTDGRELDFFFPGTPSDYRGSKNLRAQLKRLVRGAHGGAT